jgi:hypothetical protein
MCYAKSFCANKTGLNSIMRSATACILASTVCALNFPTVASADDRTVASTHASAQLRFDPQPNRTMIPESEDASPRLTLVPEPSWLTSAPASSNLPLFSRTAAPARLAIYSLAVSAPLFAPPRALRPLAAGPRMNATALPRSSSGSGHGHWLALGVTGLVVAGVGAVAYAGEQASICGGARNPGQGCSEVKTAGLVLMPVGGAMAVVGFVMHSRH